MPNDAHYGFLTYRYQRVYDPDNLSLTHPFGRSLDAVCRNERLEADLISILGTCGIQLTDDEVKSALQLPRRNESVHADYRSYYNRECAELVRERDRHLIDQYAYDFET